MFCTSCRIKHGCVNVQEICKLHCLMHVFFIFFHLLFKLQNWARLCRQFLDVPKFQFLFLLSFIVLGRGKESTADRWKLKRWRNLLLWTMDIAITLLFSGLAVTQEDIMLWVSLPSVGACPALVNDSVQIQAFSFCANLTVHLKPCYWMVGLFVDVTCVSCYSSYGS